VPDRSHGLRNFSLFLAAIGLLTYLFKDRERLQDRVNDLVANEDLGGNTAEIRPRAADVVEDPTPISPFPPPPVITPEPEPEPVPEVELDEIETAAPVVEPADREPVDFREPEEPPTEPRTEQDWWTTGRDSNPFSDSEGNRTHVFVPDDPSFSSTNPFLTPDLPRARPEPVDDFTAAPPATPASSYPFPSTEETEEEKEERPEPSEAMAPEGALPDETAARETPTATPAAGDAHDETTPKWVRPVNGECPEGFPIKARFATGHFHAPGDRGYDKITPDCCYPTVEDAERDGFTPSRWA
jgi:hypothetical protein